MALVGSTLLGSACDIDWQTNTNHVYCQRSVRWWKAHIHHLDVAPMNLGDKVYNQEELTAILKLHGDSLADQSVRLGQQLIAAKLNRRYFLSDSSPIKNPLLMAKDILTKASVFRHNTKLPYRLWLDSPNPVNNLLAIRCRRNAEILELWNGGHFNSDYKGN